MKFIQMKFIHTPLQGRLEQGMKKYGLHDPMLHMAENQAPHLSHEEKRLRGRFQRDYLSFAPATICHIAIMLFPAYHGRGLIGDMENSFPELRKVDQKF